ncbi:MAG: hypothetical protein P8H56_10215 [Crocinitomicaceae bacterium]|nr:hypothetical protein [Crocinitomicaceae bacterium]
MEIFDFIFRLGVVFAIYGFLWGIFDLALRLSTAGRPRSVAETYILKAVKYFFLVDVAFLFCFDDKDLKLIVVNQVVIAGIVLLTYFIGKFKKSQNKSALFSLIGGRGLPQMPNSVFNLKLEIVLIIASLAIFTLFWFFPSYSTNPISRWFHESILNIEDTPFFGFIFKIIGFFFLISLLVKMMNGITFLLNGGKVNGANSGQNPFNNNRRDNQQQDNDDDFVDYEEVD